MPAPLQRPARLADDQFFIAASTTTGPLHTAYAHPKYYEDALRPELFHVAFENNRDPKRDATFNCLFGPRGACARLHRRGWPMVRCGTCDFEIGPAPDAAPKRC
jgi:hypothetical protein